MTEINPDYHVHNIAPDSSMLKVELIVQHNLDTLMPMINHELLHGTNDAPSAPGQLAELLLKELDTYTLRHMFIGLAGTFFRHVPETNTEGGNK